MAGLMLYFPFSAAINATTSLFFGIFLLVKDYHSRISRYFFYFSMSAAAWSICYFMWQISKDAASALFWSRALMYGAIFASISYFHLVLVYLKLDRTVLYRRILLFFYSITIVWLIANSTPYFVTSVSQHLYFNFWPNPGLLYGPFLTSFFIQVVLASFLLLRSYRHSQGIERKRHGLILVGLFFAFIGGSTNYFLWYGIPIPPYGNILVSLYVVLTAYAILKYHFLDLKIIATEIFTALMVLVFSADVFLSKGLLELVFRIFGLLVVLFFGILLIRSVIREVERREEMERLSAELEHANARLRELDQAKTDFLSMASHQLRSPLTVVRLGLGALMDGTFGDLKDQRQIDAAKKMLESTNRLINLIGEYLNISRIEMGKMKYEFKEQDLCALAKDIVEEYQPRAQAKQLTLTFKKVGNVPAVSFDEEKLRHVIVNLVDNSIKYTPTGSVAVSCEVVQNPSALPSPGLRPSSPSGRGVGEGGGGVLIKVQDTGLGLDSDDIAVLFQKFRRASSSDIRRREGEPIEGSGLGLHVAKMFVEKHGGKIWAESPGRGKGASFIVELPLTPPPLTADEAGAGGKGVELPKAAV